MNLADFQIGLEFRAGGGTFRCTDVGTRTVVAIRIDEVKKATKHPDGSTTSEMLSGADAECEGWFEGPPYAVAEYVFDEDSLEGCDRLDS